MALWPRIEVLADHEALISRVLELDDVPGIYMEQGSYKVLLEGNEASYMQELPASIIEYLTTGADAVSVEYRSLGASTSQVKEISAVLLIFMSVIIGGLTAGLNIVNERETKTMRALAVSPLDVTEYMVGKIAFTLAAGVLLSLGTALIYFGTTGYSLLHLLVVSIITSVFGLVVGVLME